jgi:diadenylate cyclase
MCDALCLVVSEERGVISFARSGEIQRIPDAAQLSVILSTFYDEVYPNRGQSKAVQDFFKKNTWEKIIALGMALILWAVLVNGGKVIYRTYSIPVKYTELPSHLEIAKISPPEINATFSGQRRDFYFLGADQINLFLRTLNLKPGLHTIVISGSNISYPKSITLENIVTRRVRVEVAEKDNEKVKLKQRAMSNEP